MTPIWLNIAPLGGAEGDAEAAADAKFLLDNTPIDAFAYSMALFPEGKPLADKATPFAADFVRRRAAVAKAAPGLRQGILFQATMGHGWTPNVPAEGQLVVRKDGSTVYKFCPLAQSFRDYMRDQARTLAATKPDFFMIDDDTRLNSWVDGCFCPGHLAEFSRRTGRTWTREALVAMCYRYVQTLGGGFDGLWAFQLDFPDAGDVSDDALEAMSWCVMNGVINGMDGTLNPQGTATRAQTATILMRLFNLI